MRDSRVFLESFLDGLGVAGLGAKLHRPGAPTHLFAEESPMDLAESEADLSSALAMLKRAVSEADSKATGRLDLRMFPEETALLRRLVEGALARKQVDAEGNGVHYRTSHGASQ